MLAGCAFPYRLQVAQRYGSGEHVAKKWASFIRKDQSILKKEIERERFTDGSILVQTSCQAISSMPAWFGEFALLIQDLHRLAILPGFPGRVCFARHRCFLLPRRLLRGRTLDAPRAPWSGAPVASGAGLCLPAGRHVALPAREELSARERRQEVSGSVFLASASGIRRRRPGLWHEPCPWQGKAAAKPRQVCILFRRIGSGAVVIREEEMSLSRIYAMAPVPPNCSSRREGRAMPLSRCPGVACSQRPKLSRRWDDERTVRSPRTFCRHTGKSLVIGSGSYAQTSGTWGLILKNQTGLRKKA